MSEQHPPPDDGTKPCAAPEASAEAQASAEPSVEASLDRLERTARERGMTITQTGREPRLAPAWFPGRFADRLGEDLPPCRVSRTSNEAAPPATPSSETPSPATPTSQPRPEPVFQYPRGALSDQFYTSDQEAVVNRGIRCLPPDAQRTIRDSYAGHVDRRVLVRRCSSIPPAKRWFPLGSLTTRPWVVPVVEHLEALGFGFTEEPQSGTLCGVRPEGASHFLIEPTLMQVRVYVALNERTWSDPRGALAMVNRLNEHFVVARATLDGDGDLVVTAAHAGEYGRCALQTFMQRWLNDLRAMATHAGDAWAYYREPIRPPADTDPKDSEDEGEEP